MTQQFDPYHRWLGIPSAEQPPHHYRLLGLQVFEPDIDVIDSVAQRSIGYLQEIQDGPHLREAQKLLNELVAARRCLLDPAQKGKYDQQLRNRLDIALPPDVASPAEPPRKQSPSPTPPPPVVSTPPTRIEDVALPETRSRGSQAAPATDVKQTGSRLPPTHLPPTRLLLGAGGVIVLLVAMLLFAAPWSREPEPTATNETPSSANGTVPVRPQSASQPIAANSKTGEPSEASGILPVADHFTSDLPIPTLLDGVDGLPTTQGQSPATPSERPGVSIPIQGLLLWLDAAALPYSEDPLDRWEDRSATGFEVRQETARERPLVVADGLNGQPVVRFLGEHWMEIRGSAEQLKLSRFSILHVAAGHEGVLVSKGWLGGNGNALVAGVNDLATNAGGDADRDARGRRITITDDDPTQFRVRSLIADDERVSWFLDGRLSTSEATGFPISSRCNARLGVDYFSSGKSEQASFFRGEVAELLVYNRPLSDQERTVVERYLNEKWLPAHNLATLPPLASKTVSTEEMAEQAITPEAAANRTAAAESRDLDALVSEPRETGKTGFSEQLPLAETGAIQRSMWRDFHGATPDDAIQYMADHPDIAERSTLDRFEAPEDCADHYCQRVWGFLQPPASGEYRFTIKANQEAALYLSDTEDPNDKRLLKEDETVALQHGRAYYIEGIHWETSGKDYFRAGWRLPDGSQQDPIPGEYLATQARITPEYEKGFVILKPLHAEADQGVDLKVLENRQLLASGDVEGGCTYRVVVAASLPEITALRLEALPHNSLPNGGPGCAEGGSFRLAEIAAEVSSADGEEPGQQINFRAAIVGDDRGAARLIDGNLDNFWTPRPVNQPATIELICSRPLSLDGPVRLTFVLKNRDNLGCFRLSATAMPDPLAASQEPGDTAAGDRAFALFVNLGGDAWTDPEGNRWLASRDFDGQTFGHDGGSNVTSDVVDHPVFGTQRRKLTAFRAVVPNGLYSVHLLFRETDTLSPERRAFAIRIEGRPVAPQPFFGPGMGANYTHAVPRVLVRDGKLDIDFFPSSGSLAMLNGIVIQQIE